VLVLGKWYSLYEQSALKLYGTTPTSKRSPASSLFQGSAWPFLIKPEVIVSTRRPSPETLESLYATLQKLEQTHDPVDESFHELKRIILARISDIELAQALETIATPGDETHEPADLIPPPPAAEEIHPEGPTKDTNLDKFD
jgi:hypothetical protein